MGYIEQEDWKSINEYSGIYEISSLGRVRSTRKGVSKIISGGIDSNGYKHVCLCKNGSQKMFRVHILVSNYFLGHVNDGTHNIVVDHISGDKTDNRVSNLELKSNRANCIGFRSDRFTKSSVFSGVSFAKSKKNKKWLSQIKLNGEHIFLSYSLTEIEAKEIYDKALNSISDGSIHNYIKSLKPKYRGCSWDKSRKSWIVSITRNGVKKHIGRFKTEEDASTAYKKAKDKAE